MRLLRTERALVTRLFDGILPSGVSARLPLGAGEAGVVSFFEDHLGYLPRRTRVGLRAAVDLLGAASLVHPRGVRRALETLAGSRLYAVRELVTLLKSVVCMGYFSDARVRRELGLDLTLEESRDLHLP
jgi:hypothetical protein